MTAKSEVRVAGEFISPAGIVGDLKWSSRWGAGPSGCDLASWTWDVSMAASLPGVTRGAEVEIRRGGKCRWLGNVTEPVRGRPWTINAEGKSREAMLRPALDVTGEPTVNPEVAVANAGLSWNGFGGFANVDFGAVNRGQVNYLDALLNDWSKANGLRWGVWADGYGFATADPTEPAWLLNASELEIGVTDERNYTRIVARYVSAVVGDPAEPSDWSTVDVGEVNGRVFIMDLTSLGLLSPETATDYAEAQLAEFSTPAWTNRVTVPSVNLTTLNGIPADLADVRAGQMVHLHGVPLTLGRVRNRFATEVVLGEVEWVDGSQEITLAPLSLAVRSIVDEVAARSPARGMVA